MMKLLLLILLLSTCESQPTTDNRAETCNSQEVEALRAELQAVVRELQVLRDEVQIVRDHDQELESLRGELQQLKDVQAQVAIDVSFSAYAAYGWQNPAYTDVIQFVNITTNNGGHYKPQDSEYVCPLDGTYFFTFSLYTPYLSYGERNAGMILMDGQRLSESYCPNFQPHDIHIQCGTSVVTQCHKDQRVSVGAADSKVPVFGLSKRTTFSGFLIQADI